MIQSELPYDMTFVFCVQEEVGTRGSRTATYQVQPQAAIVVETTTAADVAGVPNEKQCAAWAKVRLFPLWIKEPFMIAHITIWHWIQQEKNNCLAK